MALSYEKFGLILKENNDIEYREWAPNAKQVTIFGDFNFWNRQEHICKRDEFGVFSITLKALEGTKPLIKHGDRFKI